MTGHWLLADGHRRGSRSGFASKWEAKHFADACEVAEAPIRHTDWLHLWHAACEGNRSRAGGEGGALLPGARFHALRHTHTTVLTELGVRESLCDDRLGHHPPGARSIYNHPNLAMRAAMIAEVEARWTQVAVRAGVDVERLFTDRDGAQVVVQVRGGTGSSHARCGRGTAVG